MSLPMEEIRELLRQVAAGELPVKRTNPLYAFLSGDEEFYAGGWRFTIFFDCNSIDYLDSVVTPSGEKIDIPFDDGEAWIARDFDGLDVVLRRSNYETQERSKLPLPEG